MRTFLSGMLLAVLGVGAAYAQSLPPGMTMHRTQAGSFDASGWTHADSTLGGFSVSLPCKFNDFMVNDDKPDSPTSKAYAVGCTTADKKRLSAMRIEYRGGAAVAQTYFDKVTGDGAPGTPSGSGEQAGLHYVQRKVETSGQCAMTRVLHAPAYNLILIVEAPRCDGIDKLSAKFFGSLALKPRQ